MASRFSRGMSTPAIRAMSALPLLVTGVGGADDGDPASTADHLAVLTDSFDAGLDLHDVLVVRPFIGDEQLLVAVRDPSAGEVVRGQFDLHTITGKDANVVHTHLSRDMREYLVPVVQLHSEHGVFLRLEHGAFEDDGVFFGLW